LIVSRFGTYIEETLVPALMHVHTVVPDDMLDPKISSLRERIDVAGSRQLYLPAY
jgi:hypothetical protein